MSLIEKLLSASAGSVATIEPDWVVVNDSYGREVVAQAKGVKYPERTLVFHDHDVPTGSSDAASVFKAINEFSQKYKTEFVQAKGIGYCYMLDGIVKPGNIIIHAGKHASIFGSVGALGLSVSPIELARVLEGGKYSLVVPKTFSLKIEGRLNDGVSAMDLGFALLKALGSKKDFALEVTSSLAMEEKMILSAMLSLTGANAVLFTEEACESADFVFDASSAKRMVMLPVDTPENQMGATFAVTESIENVKFNAGLIEGYTAGRIESLRKCRDLIKGKKLKLGFRLSISPATSKDYLLALKEGIIADFIDYGAQILAPADHSIVSQGPGAMGENENLITTGLYTYSGCMGLESAHVYSASAETVIERSWA